MGRSELGQGTLFFCEMFQLKRQNIVFIIGGGVNYVVTGILTATYSLPTTYGRRITASKVTLFFILLDPQKDSVLNYGQHITLIILVIIRAREW
jgi:hypothetical protein